MFDDNPLIETVEPAKDSVSEDQPTPAQAQKFISESLGLRLEEIKWDKLVLKEVRAQSKGWADTFRFSSGEGTKPSIQCFYSRSGESRFTNVVVSEHEPISDSPSALQKVFRIAEDGGVSLEVKKERVIDEIIEGDLLLVSSESKVENRGIVLPPELQNMDHEERKQLLMTGIYGVLIKNGIIEKPEGFDTEKFPTKLIATAANNN